MAMTTIQGFHQDAAGDWVAELSCGHAQHVRHRPPWELRPWIMSEAGRAGMRDAAIACGRCKMPELPELVRGYKQTATFTETTVPAGLLRDHRTRAGVWARIVVTSGSLEYTLEAPARVFVLTPGCPGIVPPEAPHFVRPTGALQFHVEFLREEATRDGVPGEPTETPIMHD